MSSYGQVATGIGRSAFAQTDASERQQNELSKLIEFLSAPKYATPLKDGIPFKTTVKFVREQLMPMLNKAGFTVSETEILSPDKKSGFKLANGKFDGEALDWLASIYNERSRQSAVDSAIARQPIIVAQAAPQPVVPSKKAPAPSEKPKEPGEAKPEEAKPVAAPKAAEPVASVAALTKDKAKKPVDEKEEMSLKTDNVVALFTGDTITNLTDVINNYLLVLQDIVARNPSLSSKGHISPADELEIRYTSLKPKKGIDSVPILYQNYLIQLSKNNDAGAAKSLEKLRELMPWMNQKEKITGALKDKVLNDAKAFYAVAVYVDFSKNPTKYKASQKADLEKDLVPSLKAIANMVLSPTEKESFLEALKLGTKKGNSNAIKIIKENIEAITNLQIPGFDTYAKQKDVAGAPAKALFETWLKINPLSGRGVRLAALEQYDFESKYIIQKEYLSEAAYTDTQASMNEAQKTSIKKAAAIEVLRSRLVKGKDDPKQALNEAIALVKGVPGLEKINSYLTDVGKLTGDKLVLTYTLLSIAEAQLLHNTKNGGIVKENETSHLHWAKTFFPKIFVPGSQGYNKDAEEKVALFFANRSIQTLMPYHASLVQRYVYQHLDEFEKTADLWNKILTVELTKSSPEFSFLFLQAGSIFNRSTRLDGSGGVTAFTNAFELNDPEVKKFSWMHQSLWPGIIMAGQNPYLEGEFKNYSQVLGLGDVRNVLSGSTILLLGKGTEVEVLHPAVVNGLNNSLELKAEAIESGNPKSLILSKGYRPTVLDRVDKYYLFDIETYVPPVVVPPPPPPPKPMVAVYQPAPAIPYLVSETWTPTTPDIAMRTDTSYAGQLNMFEGGDTAAKERTVAFGDGLKALGSGDPAAVAATLEDAWKDPRLYNENTNRKGMSADDKKHYDAAMLDFQKAQNKGEYKDKYSEQDRRGYLRDGLDELTQIGGGVGGELKRSFTIRIPKATGYSVSNFATGVVVDYTVPSDFMSKVFNSKMLMNLTLSLDYVWIFFPGVLESYEGEVKGGQVVPTKNADGTIKDSTKSEKGSFKQTGLEIGLRTSMESPINRINLYSQLLAGGKNSFVTDSGEELGSKESITTLNVVGAEYEHKFNLDEKKRYLLMPGVGAMVLNAYDSRDNADNNLAVLTYAQLTLYDNEYRAAVMIRSGLNVLNNPAMYPFGTVLLAKNWDDVSVFLQSTLTWNSIETATGPKHTVSNSGGVSVRVAGPIWLEGELNNTLILDEAQKAVSPDFLNTAGFGGKFRLKVKF